MIKIKSDTSNLLSIYRKLTLAEINNRQQLSKHYVQTDEVGYHSASTGQQKQK